MTMDGVSINGESYINMLQTFLVLKTNGLPQTWSCMVPTK